MSWSLLAVSALARAQEPDGGEFQVNTFTNGPQIDAAVARQAEGSFMVVWSSTIHTGESGSGVFGRIYDAAGVPLTGEIHVNTYTTSTQAVPDVAAAPNGEFIVVWESLQDATGREIFGQRIGPSGARLGDEFHVNNYTTRTQTHPRVAVSATGSFVVVWEGDTPSPSPLREDVFGRCYAADGTPASGVFQVNAARVNQPQYAPDVAMAADGRFAVVWTDAGVDRTDAQLYTADCQRSGSEFTALEGLVSTIAMDPAGNFVVAGIADDGDLYGISARLFSSAGLPKGDSFQVNTATTEWQDYPSVAMEPGGDFVVAWHTYLDPDTVPARALDDVSVRAFRANGAPAGPELAVNTYTSFKQQGTAVAADAAGNFVVVWNSPSDGSTSAIAAQRFLAPDLIFADGFESGDLTAWSNAVTDGGDLSAAVAGAMAGTGSGLEAVVDDTAGLYVQDDSPSDEDRYRARFYFDPNGFDPGLAQAHLRTRVFIGFEEAPNRRLFAVVLRRQGAQFSLLGRVRRDDNGQTDTGFFPITDGPHYVEVDWRRSTAPDAPDGVFEMWIDGVSVSTLSGLDNSVSAVDFVRMGALSVKGGAGGTLLWDELESRRRGPIGERP